MERPARLVSSEDLVKLAHFDGLINLYNIAIQNAIIKGVLTVDQSVDLRGFDQCALMESDCKKRLIELELTEGQEDFKLILNEYPDLSYDFPGVVDFSENALKNFNEIKTFDQMKLRSKELFDSC